ncbi:MAG TPA: hypothetical protein VFR84_04895 [Candidatus Angelobacter sp.]|nr:hypothetical protein [Candidatus Angelobacter sp.]
MRKIGEACDELDRLAEENPELVGRVTRGAEEHKEAYLRLKARLQMAAAAPRCRWLRQDGTGCGSPQMKRHIYCFAHKQMAEAQALALLLPALEDANAIQVGLMRIQKALIDDTISTKKAGLLLYSMQLALQNVGQVTFGQAKAEKPVTEPVSLEQAIREDVLTAEDAEIAEKSKISPRRRGDAEERQGLPQMNADDADQQKGLPGMNADGRRAEEKENGGEVEYVAVPGGGYRFTTYRLKVEPGISTGGRPTQPEIPPQPAQERRGPGTPEIALQPAQERRGPGTPEVPPSDHAEPRAILG